MAKNSHSHWVEELFPPSFDINDVAIEEETKSLLDKIDIRDVESLKALYERINSAVNCTRPGYQKSTSKDEGKLPEQTRSVWSRDDVKILRESTRNVSAENEQVVDEKDTHKREDPPEQIQSVWSREELEILRESTRNVNLENRQLKARLKCYELETKTLKDELLKLQQKNEEVISGFRDISAANERLHIQNDSQSKEIDSMRQENRRLVENVKQLKEDNIYKNNKFLKLSKKYGKLKIKSQRLILEAKEFRSLLENEKQLLTDNLVTLYEKKIGELQCNMDTVKEEFESQQRVYSVTKKGLEQLQLHFADMKCQDRSDGDFAISL